MTTRGGTPTIYSCTITHESDTMGKAVAFIAVGVALSQLIVGSSLGFIISAYGSTRIVLVVALLGECFATTCAMFVTTKPTSHDCRWGSWQSLVKCLQHRTHHSHVQETSEL